MSPDGGVESGWISSDNPLVVDDIVGNVVVNILSSGSGVFIECSFLLGSHSSTMGSGSGVLR